MSYNLTHINSKIRNTSRIRSTEHLNSNTYGHILHENMQPILHMRMSLMTDLLIAVDNSVIKWENTRYDFSLSTYGWYPNRHRIHIPTVILLTANIPLINARNTNGEIIGVDATFITAIVIFLDVKTKSVGIGCPRCYSDFPSYSTLDSDKPKILLGFGDLVRFWKKLHLNLYYGKEQLMINWPAMVFQSLGQFQLESCELYGSYFRYINCSNFESCATNHHKRIKLFKTQKCVDYPDEVLPFGATDVDYTFQVITPKSNFLDANFGAFLSPLTLPLWILTFTAAFVLFCLLFYLEKEKLNEVVLWLLSIFLEQSRNPRLLNWKRLSKAVLHMWMFCSLSLTQSYTSNLYSFLTSERQPTGIPRYMRELVDSKIFDIVVPYWFCDELNLMLWRDYSNLPPQLSRLYFKICQKSYEIMSNSEIDTIENFRNGIAINVYMYNSTRIENATTLLDITRTGFRTTKLTKRFQDFAVICKEKCGDLWKLTFNVNTNWHLIERKEYPFVRSKSLWTIDHYLNIKTSPFRNFLGFCFIWAS
ncbi:unnamed protein product [Orchesella dallaii]|uniref:Uncharacterized protein n=1 Tax=Orchesella dallaii TaxID=48710 RepID=A0ABP1RLV0_9HEXA